MAMASGDVEQLFLNKNFFSWKSNDSADDELQSFSSWLKWMCLDQSNAWQTFLSWTLFLILSFCVPILSHLFLSCPTCDSLHSRRPFNVVVQLSLTVISTLSFICLSRFIKKYGLRRFLFLDKLCFESEKVRHGYTDQLNGSFKILSYFVLPCFIAESTYKIWWYSSAGSRIPFLGNEYASDAIACILELCSWLYRTSIFFFICILFSFICHLQILRLQEFTEVFQEEYDVATVLKEHLRIRRQLKVISHRFRAFILMTLVFVTASQLASLPITMRYHADVNIFKAGELALCSIGLVTGLFICLRGAAKITHKAQAITSHAAKWHVSATIDSFDTQETETHMQIASYPRVFSVDIDSEEEVLDRDDVDDTKFVPPHAHTISYQKRQALVTYFENNRAGITVFGFMLDRTWLHTIFGIELSLVLWFLKKTVAIS